MTQIIPVSLTSDPDTRISLSKCNLQNVTITTIAICLHDNVQKKYESSFPLKVQWLTNYSWLTDWLLGDGPLVFEFLLVISVYILHGALQIA